MTARDGAPVALPFVAHVEPDIPGTPALHGAVTPDAFRSIDGSAWLSGLHGISGSAEKCPTVGEAQRLAPCRNVP